MKLLMIAKSNIKKNINMSLTLVALIIFASMLLYIGTSVVLHMDTFLDRKNDELNGSDFTIVAPKRLDESIQKITKEIEGYKQLEAVNSVICNSTIRNITLDEKSQIMGCVLLNADSKEKISRLKIINEGDKKLANSIILPYFLKIANKYKTGDEVSITFGGKTHTYIIYGFAEDIVFASPSNISFYKCYVFDHEFDKLYGEEESTQFSLIKTKLEKGSDPALFNDKFIKKSNNDLKESTQCIMTMNYAMMKTGASIFLKIIMTILIAFSIIIILIAITVVRFAIVTYIEGNMKNIGAMEALGYTGKELLVGMLLQFTLITMAGITIGLFIAISCTGIVTNLASSAIGLVWESNIDLIAIGVDITVIMFLVISITYLTSAKIKKITPIVALRCGIDTHNFKKSYIPLSKSSLSINAAIGVKSLIYHMKQNITILIIVTLMSFVSVFSFTVNYNFNVDNKALLQLIGMERSHLKVSYEGKDALQLFDEIGQMENVKKTVRLTGVEMAACLGNRDITPRINICNDYSQLNIKTIVKGRYPIHDNEIAITGLVVKKLKAKLGDVITLKMNNTKQEFIIVGISQQVEYLGRGACITEDGMKRISTDFIPSGLYLSLSSSEEIASVTKAIEDKYSNMQLGITNVEETFNTTLESFNRAMTGLCIACIVITFSIITLILYLLIKIRLIKERMHIGVAKALGYTTRQIITQIVISFCPVCILGAFIGTVFGMYLINPFISAMLSVSGILNSHFTISFMLTGITFLSISTFSVLITSIIARSVRKITPRELFL